MNAAANYAFVNREVLSYNVQEIIQKTLNTNINFDLLYDLSHNLSTLETHNKKKLLVCRKGATRVFPPNKLPKTSIFKDTGSPIILPGSMLDYSYVLVPGKNISLTMDTVAHGSGRVLSRKDAKQNINFEDLKMDLEKKNIYLSVKSQNLAKEEQPMAYKNSKQVVSSLEQNNLVKKVVNLKPLIVLIG
jgi:tRNA-splicing ligase RtcB